MTDVTQDQILDALRAAMQPQPGGEDDFTVQELSEMLDCSRERARTAIKKLMQEGTVATRSGRRQAMDGAMRQVPVYRLRRL